ncbi:MULTISPECIES: pyruvate/oxaloacetate carboxyltransferase [unclassified Diaminobutyricimonas]|uniref:pyruvate/oxaloacetate carboxyltransferase n=1 Tax=unclassified Diaminobutyricimonas TaxID=2643261 RepID=UPI0012F4D8D0|nr:MULTISPECIES: pyruvate/oxaloacetate carboxyltransferase [unclassified Diaminobutyricimonas]
MADIRLVDVSLRDGNQSLWGATGVTNKLVSDVAPSLGRVGYHAVELMTSTMFATAVRYHSEDPWQRVRDAHAAMPDTTLGFLTTGKRFISFTRTPDNLFELAFDLLRRNGITRLWVIDPMHNMADTIRTAEMAKRVGFEEVIGGICYSISPVHTDEYYLDKIAQLDDTDAVDGLYLKDPAGLLTPQRVADMVPRLNARLRHKTLNELHSHCNTGLAPLTLLEAADHGMDILHTALPPLANGASHTNGLQLIENLAARGHTVNVDAGAMAEASGVMSRFARLHRLPAGAPAEYDEVYYRHNIPGGVLSTLRRQLSEIGQEALFPAVLDEAVQVREDLGWPIVVTPFAQYIVTQATLNVMAGERYARLSDEVIDLLLGEFGEMPGPVDQDLLDRATSSHRARERENTPEPPSLKELRQRFGLGISDEDLLMRALMPGQQVDAMVERRDSAATGSLRTLLAGLSGAPDVRSFSVTSSTSTLTVQRGTSS